MLRISLLTVTLLTMFWPIFTVPDAGVEPLSPEHRNVALHVFELRGIDDEGGTGFQVMSPKGIPYIVTNSHICDIALKDDKKDFFLNVKQADKEWKRKVISIDETSDLCLVEASPLKTGLVLGDGVKLKDKVWVIGHPHLGPLKATSGEVIEFIDVRLSHHVMVPDKKTRKISTQTCNLPKNEIAPQVRPFGLNFFKIVTMCIRREHDAIEVDAEIVPGNSGSPLVDASGKVVGVVFATNAEGKGGFAVNLQHLKLLLKDF